MSDIKFKGYCWSIGTTSYRTESFNKNIETQLKLMNEFRSIQSNTNTRWKGNGDFQSKYYYFLKENFFVKGEASRPAKDAREKTSGLKDIGLMTEERMLTEAGKKLLEISNSNNFESDNILELPKDSYIFFKQLLKTSNCVDGKYVRPFVVFTYLVSKLEFLTDDEFKYLLPLCIDLETIQNIIDEILRTRESHTDFDNIIFNVILKKDNYQKALELFLESSVDENLFKIVGINRKSRDYDKNYLGVYRALYKYIFQKSKCAVYELYEATKSLKNVGADWRKLLFNTVSKVKIQKNGDSALNPIKLLNVLTEKEFKLEFFRTMHLIKIKSTLDDYFDLNRRYFKSTDVVIFEDRKVKLDILPKCYFKLISDKLFEEAFIETDLLEKDVDLFEISSSLVVDKSELYDALGRVIGRSVTNSQIAKKVIHDERYERLNKLVNDKFCKDNLIKLLRCFQKRDDKMIFDMVTDNADIPTIFEYILGIAWYEISERKGNVLEFMNLSLEADLLPKTHAGGGTADIVCKYEETKVYPYHTLLIEATLADGNNQRRMEMEPVSRHLGDYCIANPLDEAYCIFVSTYLNPNVISDFRVRKNMTYYSLDGSKKVEGIKILPLHTEEIIELLSREVKYPKVYGVLNNAYAVDESPVDWYENNIVNKLRL